MIKNIFNSVKNFRQTLFFRASASFSKILNDKKYFNTLKFFSATLFFRASASCSKILNDEKHIFNTVKNFRANAVSRGKRKLLKKPECKMRIEYSENFQGKFVFQGTRKVAQKS